MYRFHHLHHLLGEIALTLARRRVLAHCPVKKQMMIPLSANQMGWHVVAECCGNSKVDPHTITPPPPPPYTMVGAIHSDTIHLLFVLLDLINSLFIDLCTVSSRDFMGSTLRYH